MEEYLVTVQTLKFHKEIASGFIREYNHQKYRTPSKNKAINIAKKYKNKNNQIYIHNSQMKLIYFS